mgnify:CR=1 FL=1
MEEMGMTNEQYKGMLLDELEDWQEVRELALETNNENLTGYLSEIKDIDLTTAITNWMQAQYAYQASLQVTSASMGMSLLNYL